MSQQQPPAGWYDDPSGGGGRRYWNGKVWTQQVQAGSSGSSSAKITSAEDRVDQGYMQLNGKRVPLGQMFTPKPPGQGRGLITALIVLAIVAAVGLGLAFAVEEATDDPSSSASCHCTVVESAGTT